MKNIFLISLVLFLTLPLQSLQRNFPIIGHYGNPYQLAQILYQKQLNDEQMRIITPQACTLLDKQPGNKNYYIIVSGTTDFENTKLKQPYNVIFHEWTELPDNNQVNVLMGISNLQGLTSNDLPIDQLKPFNVHLHDKAYSPNNAHLSMQTGRQFATVIIMGSFNQKNVGVLQVIIDNQQAQNTYENLQNLPIIQKLEIIKQYFNNPQDNQCIDALIELLNTIKQANLPSQSKTSSLQDLFNDNEYAENMHNFNVNQLNPNPSPSSIQNVPVFQQINSNCMWHSLLNALIIMEKLRGNSIVENPTYEPLIRLCTSHDPSTLNASIEKFYELFDQNAPDLQNMIAISADHIFTRDKKQKDQHITGITATQEIITLLRKHYKDQNYFLPVLINTAKLNQPGGDAGNHWYLLLIYLKNQILYYYVADSMGTNRTDNSTVITLIHLINENFQKTAQTDPTSIPQHHPTRQESTHTPSSSNPQKDAVKTYKEALHYYNFQENKRPTIDDYIRGKNIPSQEFEYALKFLKEIYMIVEAILFEKEGFEDEQMVIQENIQHDNQEIKTLLLNFYENRKQNSEKQYTSFAEEHAKRVFEGLQKQNLENIPPSLHEHFRKILKKLSQEESAKKPKPSQQSPEQIPLVHPLPNATLPDIDINKIITNCSNNTYGSNEYLKTIANSWRTYFKRAIRIVHPDKTPQISGKLKEKGIALWDMIDQMNGIIVAAQKNRQITYNNETNMKTAHTNFKKIYPRQNLTEAIDEFKKEFETFEKSEQK